MDSYQLKIHDTNHQLYNIAIQLHNQAIDSMYIKLDE